MKYYGDEKDLNWRRAPLEDTLKDWDVVQSRLSSRHRDIEISTISVFIPDGKSPTDTGIILSAFDRRTYHAPERFLETADLFVKWLAADVQRRAIAHTEEVRHVSNAYR